MDKIVSREALLAEYNACKGMLALRCASEHDIRSAKKEKSPSGVGSVSALTPSTRSISESTFSEPLT